MAEITAPQVDAGWEEDFPDDLSEIPLSRKAKIITATGLGIVGVAAAYTESRGYVNGWPPPAHSLKHPWIGYYAAWGISRFSRRKSAAVAASVAANALVESGQDYENYQDHYPFHWMAVHDGTRRETNSDNIIDLACCLGGVGLFLAQNSSLGLRVRMISSRLRGPNQQDTLSEAA
jgi:hypothetical protein